jgi:hypothetical protein
MKLRLSCQKEKLSERSMLNEHVTCPLAISKDAFRTWRPRPATPDRVDEVSIHLRRHILAERGDCYRSFGHDSISSVTFCDVAARKEVVRCVARATLVGPAPHHP